MVCPLAKMYTLGSSFMPSADHAGGLRFHGMSSVLSQLYDDGLMEAVSVKQTDVFQAAEEFARVEGILPPRSPATPSWRPSTRPSGARKPARRKLFFSV